ncbi:NAD-dependent succinate-semialdehyde dehydrogenase [Pseudooceanicola aestuarii]|uniref:NAD-dependent succinate-semialdehyde dehydrogenase n=1 Tax=Pseudooceanicola aestuarii TaxID=2697319 RepID=UPI0013D110BC|nr:NAD-dependent succinate-semialdehyde dehydrogenase [Pseudooceanicola aestuarii]
MPDYPQLSLFINGQWRQTADTIPVLNPEDETVIGTTPMARRTDLDDALEAAETGFRIWSRTPAKERAAVLMRAAALMRDRADEIAHANTLDMGKPLAASKQEALRGAMIMEWDAAESLRQYGRVIEGTAGYRNTVLRQPIGPVAAFSTWNFPISTAVRKVASGLAAGCSIILKAPEDTPSGAYHVARVFQDAGLPDGVLSLLYGDAPEISGYLIPQTAIRLVTFTGSTAVGGHLGTLAAQHMTPVIMELGGHAPVLVCDDVDPAQMGQMGAARKYRNSGQVCTSPTRFYVAEPLYDQFCDSFLDRARATRVGSGFDAATEMGPLVHDRRLEAMSALVEDAVQQGAELKLGGKRHGNKGYFFEPTVLANVPDTARIMQEEPFGPIAILNTMSSLDDGIAKANSVDFGLAAYGFSHKATNLDRMVDGIEVGQLSLNTFDTSLPETPFGGVKSSGLGREGGAEGLSHYTVVKNVSHRSEIG